MTKEERTEIIKKHVKEGDLISHTVCMGMLQEHIFTGWDGPWITGTPTTDTMTHSGVSTSANDIAPANVTHINREAIECLDLLADVKMCHDKP